jgi:hypothetical protein
MKTVPCATVITLSIDERAVLEALSWCAWRGAEIRPGANVEQLKTHINAFIADYNDHARPFAWTKSQVHQKRLKPCFADQ